MTYPKIESTEITIAMNYAYIYTVYKSGRRIMRTVNIKPESVMLYPMEFLKESRSIKHIINQFAINGCMPMSIKNWMFKKHPHASFKQNLLSSNIFTLRLDEDEDRAKSYEKLGYERFNY